MIIIIIKIIMMMMMISIDHTPSMKVQSTQ